MKMLRVLNWIIELDTCIFRLGLFAEGLTIVVKRMQSINISRKYGKGIA